MPRTSPQRLSAWEESWLPGVSHRQWGGGSKRHPSSLESKLGCFPVFRASIKAGRERSCYPCRHAAHRLSAGEGGESQAPGFRYTHPHAPRQPGSGVRSPGGDSAGPPFLGKTTPLTLRGATIHSLLSPHFISAQGPSSARDVAGQQARSDSAHAWKTRKPSLPRV